MIYCERCNTELPDHAVACYRCGTTVEQITFVKPIGTETQAPFAVPERKSHVGVFAGIVAAAFVGVFVVTLIATAITYALMSSSRDQTQVNIDSQKATPQPTIATTPKREPTMASLPQKQKPVTNTETQIDKDYIDRIAANDTKWRANANRSGANTASANRTGGRPYQPKIARGVWARCKDGRYMERPLDRSGELCFPGSYIVETGLLY